MDNEIKTVFRINIDKLEKKTWSFGICLTRWYEELYVYINILRWSIAIGKLYKITTFDDELEDVKKQLKEVD